MAGHRRWTDQQLREAVAKNESVHGVLRELGLKAAGGTQSIIWRKIKELEIEWPHYKGQAWMKGKTGKRTGRGKPLEGMLIENSRHSRNNVKRRLIQDCYLENKCYVCGQEPEWNGKKLVMILDHINGINNDYRLENLRLLCPNCNSQQDTFCGRNVKMKGGEADGK